MNKYDKEVDKDQELRDTLILAAIVGIYDVIREKSYSLASEVHAKADGNKYWLQERNRAERLAKKTNTTLRPEYLKRDSFIKERYAEEYRTSYFMSKYGVENQGIAKGYSFKLPRYTKKQFQTALNYPLSKLMNTAAMQTGRSLNIQQLYTTIVSGVEQGSSLQRINRELDINLGYRDSSGKWIKDKKLRKGQQYKTRRILRTEIGRIRSNAQVDQWINQQDIVESKLELVATLDDRTRQQSASMDGNYANKNGEFLYPTGWARPHQTGVARYDINDRETTVAVDPEYLPSQRIARDPKTGKNKIIPYQNATEWAKSQNPPLKRNKYGELLF